MRIDGVNPGYTLPKAAPGGGPPVDRSELDAAAGRLEQQGYKMQAFKGNWWPMSSKEWRDVDRGEGVERLKQDEELHLVKDGRAERVASQQDLLELEAFGARNTGTLPSPELAGSLAALSQTGSFQGNNGNLSTYEAYNLVMRDPNHDPQSLRFVRNGESFTLSSAQDAQTAAWLLTGFGDPAQVAPEAVKLKEIKDLGFTLDPFKTYAQKRYGATVPLTHGGQFLANMPLDRLDPKKAGELCQQWAAAQGALGQRAGAGWEALQLQAEQVPFDERLAQLKKLQEQLPEKGVELYRAVTQRLQPGEQLSARVDEALAAVAQAPSHAREAEQVYSGWAQYGASYPRLLERVRDPGMAARLARTLPTEQEPELYAMLDDLQGLDPNVARDLAMTLAEQKLLVEQRGLVAAIAAPEGTAAQIMQARDQIVTGDGEERRKLFLAYRQAQAPLPSATRLLKACPEKEGVEVYGRLRQSGLEDRQALPLLEAMASTRQPGETLSSMVEPALKLQAAQPKSWLEIYGEMRQCPGREEGFMALLERTGNAGEAARLAKELPPEQDPLFAQTWDRLKEKGQSQGKALIKEAVLQHRLAQDAGRLEGIATLSLYQSMLQQAPGNEDVYLELARTEKLQDLASSWKALDNGLPAELPGRLGLWKGWQSSLGDRWADRLIKAVPAGQKLDQVEETMAVLRSKSPKETAKAVESFEKIFQSRSPELLAHLVRGGADLPEATEMARRVGRKDLPGAQLPQTQRCELVGQLGKLRGGNLQQGFQDYLFLASRLEDPLQLPMAVDFLGTLLGTGLSHDEARMAFAELTRREEMQEHQESVLKAYRFAQDLAGAREILEEVVKLDPREAGSRLDQVVGRSLDGMEPRLRARLAAGQLVAPLSSAGLDSLSQLLGAGGLYWKPSPGWKVGGEPPALRMESAGGTREASSVESGPFVVAEGAESTLSFDLRCSQDVRLLACVEGEKDPLSLFTMGAGEVKSSRVSLSSLRGKKVRLRLETNRSSSPGVQLSQLTLTTTPVVANRQFTLNDVNYQSGQLKEPLTLSTTSDTELYLDMASGHRLNVDLNDGSNWVRLGTTGGGAEEVRFNLAPYRGKKVHLRLNNIYNGGWQARPTSIQFREGVGQPVTRPLLAGTGSSQVAEEILSMAFDPNRAAGEREDTLRALKRLGTNLEAAWKAWPALEPHVSDPDFDDRIEAVKALLPEVELLAEIERARSPQESLAALARLRKGRTAEEFGRIRERLGWESCGEVSSARVVDFVGQVQARAGTPAAADAAWTVVAPPVHDESLEERMAAYRDLLEGCQGDGPQAEAGYRQLISWLEPSEGIQRAARAAVELRALVPKNEDWLKLLQSLQASQLDGRLQGVMLKRMSTYLIGKVTLEGSTLEEALKLMPEELQGKTGIEEREQHLVVGGIRLGRRD